MPFTLDEVAFGFIKIANETMACVSPPSFLSLRCTYRLPSRSRPIRSLTEARGFSTAKHVLACAFCHIDPGPRQLTRFRSFWRGWGPACLRDGSLAWDHQDIDSPLFEHLERVRHVTGRSVSLLVFAKLVTDTLPHRAHELQEPCSEKYTDETKSYFVERIERLKMKVVAELKRQGFASDRIETECFLNLRYALSHPSNRSANFPCSYDGSDTSLMTLAPVDGSFDFQTAFEDAYRNEFGFLIEDKHVMVDDVRVRGIGKTFDTLGESVFAESARLSFVPVGLEEGKKEGMASMYFEKMGRVDVPVFLLEKLGTGDLVRGPAAIVDGTQTLILDPGSESRICSKHVYVTLH